MSEWELPKSVKVSSIERVGGGFLWESGVYDALVKMVYLNQNPNTGAISFNVILINEDDKELQEAFYIKSGKLKGNKSYYTDSKGVDRPLPGYSVANSLCIAATGESLAKTLSAAEKKTVNVYDYDAGKELPVERPVVMPLLNKKVKVAVHQMVKNKNKKNDSTGNYEPTNETRTFNECKFFGNANGQTAEEILEDKEAKFFDKWAETNTGIVIDKTVKTTESTDTAASILSGSMDSDTEVTSLFS